MNQQLTFLPGALSGLGMHATYTWTDSDADIIGRKPGLETGCVGNRETQAL